MLHKGNTEYFKCTDGQALSIFATDTHSFPMWGKVEFPGSETIAPPKALAPITGLAKHVPCFKQGAKSLLHTNQRLGEIPRPAWPPTQR